MIRKRILVCGGRDYDDWLTFCDVLCAVLGDCIEAAHFYRNTITLISGGARGADAMAETFADEYGIPITVYPADWNKYGKRAGYIRNKQMLDEGKPDLVIAFPGGKGTAMMVKIAREANVEVIEVE